MNEDPIGKRFNFLGKRFLLKGGARLYGGRELVMGQIKAGTLVEITGLGFNDNVEVRIVDFSYGELSWWTTLSALKPIEDASAPAGRIGA